MANSLMLPMRYFIIPLLLVASIAEAQMTPGGMPMGGAGPGGPTTPAGEEKKEGVGEAAPKQPGMLPTTPALPAPKGKRKKWKLLELDGYFRTRTDWFKDFNLGFIDDPTLGGAPFPRPFGCTPAVVGSLGAQTNRPCGDTLSSTNMRVRLEPTINLDEGTSIHIQADALDNIVWGSTPAYQDYALTGTPNAYSTSATLGTQRPPVGAFNNGQQEPVLQGVNSDRPSILVKRAWAEIALPIGILKVGRQPNQWGMGIYSNSGGYNPFDGTYNYDADLGDSVDRISFTAQVPGTSLRAMVAVDWDMTRLVSNQTDQDAAYFYHPFDLDQEDNVNGYVGVISKLDTPQEFRDTVDRGELALNYGVYFEYKTQSWDDDITKFTLGQAFNAGLSYVPRGYKTYTPDLWAKVGWGSFLFEGEFVAQLGSVDRLDDLGLAGSADIRKFGGTGRATWAGVENKLHVGLESGFATGDQWDNLPQGNTNIAFANQLGGPGDTTLTQFVFNRNYYVDLIMWRYLFGAITNALYVKPFISYDITKSISVKVWDVTSFALKPVSTPGNDNVYGTEFDADFSYHSGGLTAGISGGVLFPFGAMAHPADDVSNGGPGFKYGTDASGNTNVGDPSTAYTIQSRLVLAF